MEIGIDEIERKKCMELKWKGNDNIDSLLIGNRVPTAEDLSS